MASKKLQGITIEIDGNTTGLSNALADVNKNIYSVQSELNQVERLLKFDPTNTELLAQKQNILSNAINSTTEKLKTLREAKEQADKKFASGEMDEKQFRELEREIIATEQSLKKLSDSSSNANTQLGKLDDSTKKAKLSLENLKKIGPIAAKSITAVATAGAAVITALAGAEASTREYRSDISKLETNAENAGISFQTMKSELSDLVGITDETDSSVEALSNLLKTGFDETGIQSALESLSGAVIAFPDTLKIESLADGLQETLATGAATGQFAELLERSGLSLEEFDNGLANMSTTAEKQNYILETLAKTGMADVNKAYKESNKNLLTIKEAQFEFNDAIASLGETMEPVIANVMSFGSDIISSLTTAFQEGGIEAVSVEFGNVLNTILKKITEFLPQLLQMGTLLITNLITGIKSNLPQIVNNVIEILTTFVNTAITLLPQILELGIKLIIELALGLAKAIPELIPVIIEAIFTMVDTILDNLDLIIEAGIELILALTLGLIDAIPQLLAKVPEIIVKLVSKLTDPEMLAKLIKAALVLILALAEGLIKAIPELIAQTPKIITGICDNFKKVIKETDWGALGKDIINGLLEGMKNVGTAIWDGVKSVGESLVNGFKDFFGIHSPSKLMEDKIGQNLGKGIVVGIEDTISDVESAMSNLSSKVETSVNPTINPTANTNPLILQIDKFYNNRSTDIQALAEELEFYRHNAALAKGGN